MSNIGAINNSLQGIERASEMAEQSARNISRASEQEDQDMVAETVRLKIAKQAVEANVEAAKTADDMEKTTIDIIV